MKKRALEKQHNIFIREEQKVSVAKIHISPGNGYHNWRPHTCTHTHTPTYTTRTRIYSSGRSVQIRNAEQLKFLFCLTFAMIRFNQMSALRSLACSLARSFALFMKSFDSGRPHIYNEQFYLLAILFIHVKHLYVVTHYIVAFHFGRPTTHSNYFRV